MFCALFYFVLFIKHFILLVHRYLSSIKLSANDYSLIIPAINIKSNNKTGGILHLWSTIRAKQTNTTNITTAHK